MVGDEAAAAFYYEFLYPTFRAKKIGSPLFRKPVVKEKKTCFTCKTSSKMREKTYQTKSSSRMGGRFESFALFEIDLSVGGDGVAKNHRRSRRRSRNARTFGYFINAVVDGRRSLADRRRCQIQLGVVDLAFALHRSRSRVERRRRRFRWQRRRRTRTVGQRCERTVVPINGLQFTGNGFFAQTDQRRAGRSVRRRRRRRLLV